MKLAPIVLFVYNRPLHTKQTVEALQKNELAFESELFIYSDGAKDKATESKAKELRQYLRTIDGLAWSVVTSNPAKVIKVIPKDDR